MNVLNERQFKVEIAAMTSTALAAVHDEYTDGAEANGNTKLGLEMQMEVKWIEEEIARRNPTDNHMPYCANDGLDVYVNQAMRDATVLAVDGNELILEYEMPNGTSALLRYVVRNGELTGRRNISYNSVPKRWLNLIRAGGMTNWIGYGQRMCRPMPFPA